MQLTNKPKRSSQFRPASFERPHLVLGDDRMYVRDCQPGDTVMCAGWPRESWQKILRIERLLDGRYRITWKGVNPVTNYQVSYHQADHVIYRFV
jgi:hypothetical protein